MNYRDKQLIDFEEKWITMNSILDRKENDHPHGFFEIKDTTMPSFETWQKMTEDEKKSYLRGRYEIGRK